MEAKLKYYLEIADNALILSHRLGECSSNGPFLEEDLAGTNVALDLIGLAESIYNEAAKLSSDYKTGDDLAYRREEFQYYNCLLAEQPNTDFAYITTRQFFLDVFNYYFFSELMKSSDEFLKAVSTKSLKEVTYHFKRSSEWMIRMGDGTDVSNKKAQEAIDSLWKYTGELFESTESDLELREEGISADLKVVEEKWSQKISEILYLAKLKRPETTYRMLGGKTGTHSEFMGYLLADLQFLTNKYPDAVW